jgi:hypothetical protein
MPLAVVGGLSGFATAQPEARADASLIFVGRVIAGAPSPLTDAPGDVAMFCVATRSRTALFVAPLAARWSAVVPVSLLRRLLAL